MAGKGSAPHPLMTCTTRNIMHVPLLRLVSPRVRGRAWLPSPPVLRRPAPPCLRSRPAQGVPARECRRPAPRRIAAAHAPACHLPLSHSLAGVGGGRCLPGLCTPSCGHFGRDSGTPWDQPRREISRPGRRQPPTPSPLPPPQQQQPTDPTNAAGSALTPPPPRSHPSFHCYPALCRWTPTMS